MICGSLVIGQTAWAAQAIGDQQTQIDKVPTAQTTESVIVSQQDQTTEASSNVKFHLDKLTIVSGIDLGDKQAELSKMIEKYEQKEVSIRDLYGAVAEVTAFYREQGYPAATAYLPPQSSPNGAIQINVEEGKYGKIIIENESRLQTKVIERLASDLRQRETICNKQLETVIHNILDLGGVRAGGIMRPGANIGETDIVIRVEDGKRDSYIVYSENHGSKSSGRYRHGIAANWYQMSGVGDHLAINGSVSNEQQHNYGIQYDQLIAKNGTKFGINISRTDYELGSHYSALGAIGEATTIGLYGSTPLWKTSTSRLGLNYGWNYRDLKDEMKEFDYVIEKHSHTFYIGLDGMEKIAKTAVNYDLTFHTGNLSYDDARIGNIPLQVQNDGTYSKAVLNANVLHTFDKKWDMLFKIQAQQAGNNLDSSEQIYLGGANAVRAYPQGEASGDEGYQATAELRYHTNVPGLTVSSFFDIGHVKYTQDSSIAGGSTLKGWGIGLAYSEPHGYWARLDYARRIGLAQDASEEAKDKGRLWFILGKSW